MTDVDHELGAIRFVVDAPLSSKVAMFNNVANQHKQSQYLNPFSNADCRTPPRRTFGKDEYGKPLAGSLTEMRGARANIHVCKEMLELCQVIDTEGFPLSKDEPNLKVILFGDLFNIYTLISDKVVGLLLRARKYKLIDFEGEVLFQRRDDDVPVYMLKPIDEIKTILEQKQEEVRRSVSPAPQPTTVLMDNLRRSASPAPRGQLSRSPSPAPYQKNASRESTPAPIQKDKSRSVSPAPHVNNTSQNNGTSGDSPGRQQPAISTPGNSPATQKNNLNFNVNADDKSKEDSSAAGPAAELQQGESSATPSDERPVSNINSTETTQTPQEANTKSDTEPIETTKLNPVEVQDNVVAPTANTDHTGAQ